MKIKDLMTTHVICCTPMDSAKSVAKMMKAHDVGALPVVSDPASRRLLGIVTDRDLCSVVVASGKNSESVRIHKVMTRKPVTCRPEDNLEHCLNLMERHRIRRIPVVDEKGSCIGIVAQADVAGCAPALKVREVVAKISRPWAQKRHLRAAA
jgi:CBS-domain-containing membrane protein